MFALSAALLSFSTLAAAQSVTTISVGKGGLAFNPSTVTAKKGDVVSFVFDGGSAHSVTQSSFASPCQYLENGFDSGVVSYTGSVGSTPTSFNITVDDDSKPIWFYCKVPSHCQSQMVGGINVPSSGNTIDAFKTAAKSASSGSQPSAGSFGASSAGAAASAAPGPIGSGVTVVGAPTGGAGGSGSGSGSTNPGTSATGSSGAASPSSSSSKSAASYNSAAAGAMFFSTLLGILAA